MNMKDQEKKKKIALLKKSRKGGVAIRFDIIKGLVNIGGLQKRTNLWRISSTLSYDAFMNHIKIMVDRKLVRLDGEHFIELTDLGYEIYNKALPVIKALGMNGDGENNGKTI